jgi:hypothetical protein
MVEVSVASGFVVAVDSCAEFLQGLGLRLVLVISEDRRRWLHERARWEGWWPEAGPLIRRLEHVHAENLPAAIGNQPDLVPLLTFTQSCTYGVTWTSWAPTHLDDLPLRGRLVATTWSDFDRLDARHGSVDLWAWEPGVPTIPVARWSELDYGASLDS